MTTRTSAFAPLSAILLACVLNAALSGPTAAATDVPFTNFQGAWVTGATYSAGIVVTYDGASYIALKENTRTIPAGHPGNWAPLGSSSLFGSNSVSYMAGIAGAQCDLGALLLTAAKTTPSGYVPADGTLYSIADNTLLFGLLGTTFGGDGSTTFALPDLRAVAPNNTIYLICVIGIYP
jgi:hypothetical protein